MKTKFPWIALCALLGASTLAFAHDLATGEVGAEAFRLLVHEPRLARVPLLLETPDSETMHAANLAFLRELQAA